MVGHTAAGGRGQQHYFSLGAFAQQANALSVVGQHGLGHFTQFCGVGLGVGVGPRAGVAWVRGGRVEPVRAVLRVEDVTHQYQVEAANGMIAVIASPGGMICQFPQPIGEQVKRPWRD